MRLNCISKTINISKMYLDHQAVPPAAEDFGIKHC